MAQVQKYNWSLLINICVPGDHFTNDLHILFWLLCHINDSKHTKSVEASMCQLILATWQKSIMHELLCKTIFGSRVRRFANDFHKWRSHEWKSLVNRIMSEPKIVTHGNECIILFLTHNFMYLTHNFSKKTIMDPSRTVFSDLALWRHHSSSVM